MTRLPVHEHDPEFRDLLRRVDRSVEVPSRDAQRESTLLTEFDRAWQRGRPFVRRRQSTARWIPIAGPIAAAAAITLLWVNTGAPPPRRAAEPLASSPIPQFTEFIAWPGAAALPRLENGELLRMNLPSSVLPSLGIFPPASDDAVIVADVIVGQDGLPRAVRLVP
jgi:hypothetical protein